MIVETQNIFIEDRTFAIIGHCIGGGGGVFSGSLHLGSELRVRVGAGGSKGEAGQGKYGEKGLITNQMAKSEKYFI